MKLKLVLSHSISLMLTFQSMNLLQVWINWKLIELDIKIEDKNNDINETDVI